MNLVYLFLALWLLGWTWFAVCTQRGFKQRMTLINLAGEAESQKALYLLRGIQKVSFVAHVCALFLFRDPMLLYSAGLREMYQSTKVPA